MTIRERYTERRSFQPPRPAVACSSMTTASTRSPGPASGGLRFVDRGFTIIELLIVVVIVGLLATIVIPKFNGVRQRGYNSAALADLHSAALAIEEYVTYNYVLPDENQLMASGFALSGDVSFTTFDIRDPGDPENARVHMHIEHQGSDHYYHYEYPATELPEIRLK